MRRFYAESTASELAWNDCPEFGHLRLCNHSPDIPLVRRCDPHTPSYIKSGYQRSRAPLPTAAALSSARRISSTAFQEGKNPRLTFLQGFDIFLHPCQAFADVPHRRLQPPYVPTNHLHILAHRLHGIRHPRNQYPGARYHRGQHQYRLTSTRPRPRRRIRRLHRASFHLPALLCSSARSQRIRTEQPVPLSSTNQSSESHDGIETSRSSSEPDSGERPDGVGWRQARSGRTA